MASSAAIQVSHDAQKAINEANAWRPTRTVPNRLARSSSPPPGVRFLYVLNSDSDAAKSAAPSNRANLVEANDLKWREKLGALLAEHRSLNLENGAVYILGELPEGFKLWKRPRPGSSHVDYYCYGLASGASLDSTMDFFKHLVWLDDGMAAGACACRRCA